MGDVQSFRIVERFINIVCVKKDMEESKKLRCSKCGSIIKDDKKPRCIKCGSAVGYIRIKDKDKSFVCRSCGHVAPPKEEERKKRD